MVIRRGSSKSKKIALTFDDGPNPVYTPRILTMLRNADAKATFFLIGKNAEAYPDIVKAIAADGHDLGNHTFKHPSLSDADEEEIRSEITKCSTIISNIIGRVPAFFRPPAKGMSNLVQAVADSLGLKIILWSAGGSDWNWNGESGYNNKVAINKKTQEIIIDVMNNIQHGTIFDLHDGSDEYDKENWEKRAIPTVCALPKIINVIQSCDFSLVSLSEMELIEEAIDI